MPATAKCTATGWEVMDVCYPAACSKMPPPPPAPSFSPEDPDMFANGALPGYISQVRVFDSGALRADVRCTFVVAKRHLAVHHYVASKGCQLREPAVLKP